MWTRGARNVAWGWVEPPAVLSLVVDPAVPELVGEVLDWFDAVSPGSEHRCVVLQTELHVVKGLESRDYQVDVDEPYFRHHAMTIGRLEEPAPPAGFRLRHVEPGEAEQRAAVHRAGWSDFGSSLTAADYSAVMNAWPYRHDLDWVVEAPSGELVASALGWIDDVNQAGLLEPVSCDPLYRRTGLSRAVNLACLHAMGRAGARTAHVGPRGDKAYPVPGRLYRSIGFLPGARTVSYLRLS